MSIDRPEEIHLQPDNLRSGSELTSPYDQIVKNLLTITNITSQRGEKPARSPSSQVSSVSVDCLDYRLQSTLNLDAVFGVDEFVGKMRGLEFYVPIEQRANPHLELVRSGKPKPDQYKAQSRTEIDLTVRPDLIVHLTVDPDRFPEARDFENPQQNLDPNAPPELRLRVYKVISPGFVDLAGPLKCFGPKALDFINKFTTEVCTRFLGSGN